MKKYHIIKCLYIVCIIIFTFSIVSWSEEGQESLEHRTEFYYTIQKGDTLWDLSQRFSNSPWEWPNLWEENKQIPNPHRIYPGERIRLYRWESVDKIFKRKAKNKLQKIIKLKEPQKELPYFYYPSIDSIGFIKKKPVSHHGSIVKSKDDKILISKGDLVYIKPKGDIPLLPGNKYIVCKILMPCGNKAENKLYGFQYYLTGIVEIRKIESTYTIAKVIKSFRAIEVGQLLIPYKYRSPNITLSKSTNGLQGKIIVSEGHSNMFGASNIAFIDKGKVDKVKPGQSYIIYRDTEQKNIEPHEYSQPVINVGTLIVLHTEQNTSTVIIKESNRSIHSGEKIRSPKVEREDDLVWP